MSSEINPSARDQSQELLNSIIENLKTEADPDPKPSPTYCIYQVPKRLRMVNEKAYSPQLVSIGPLHHGKEELIDMEEQKALYLQYFLDRFSQHDRVGILSCILSYIKNNEQRIRNCYANSFKLENSDFINMILYDAIFILELFLRYFYDESDFYLSKSIMYIQIRQDILLLENQIPYFVLDDLCNFYFPVSFMILCSKFFDKDISERILPETSEVLHFTDFFRWAMLKYYPLKKFLEYMVNSDAVKFEELGNLPNAVKLQESGVKFKNIDAGLLLDIRLEVQKRKIPCFKVKELQIPSISVVDETELWLRNIMALEQLHYSGGPWFCSYVDFLDRLIETEKDVDLLCREGIIENCLGDNASVANMFNKLGNEIVLPKVCYKTICLELIAHYNSSWNHTEAMLKSVYFSNLWRGTATVAAVILLLLTVTQTVFSILH